MVTTYRVLSSISLIPCYLASINQFGSLIITIFFFTFRNSGMGIVSLASDIGGSCSPFVVQMTRVKAILPFAFMGGLSFIAAFLCWFLPETLGKRTPEVIEDTEVKQGRHIHTLEIYGLPALCPRNLKTEVTF